ncbi:hypothetical protein ABPG77_006857 [Micractinium sp. CCAP 211/92]
MAGVAATVLAGPASSVYVLGPAATLLLPSVGAMLGVNLGLGVHPGFYTKPDKITSAVTFFFVACYFLLLFYMTFWRKVEAFFAYTPWLRHNGRMHASVGGRKYATRCPFTGEAPTMRCPSCGASVHDDAYHKPDRLVSIAMGETVLRWDAAKLATEQDGDLGKARRTLDAILDFRGNMLFGTVTGCCTGCAHWQRCFNLLPRLSLSMAFAGMFFAFIPWAFASFLSGNSTGSSIGRSAIGGGGAKAVHTICNVLAVAYAQAGLMVQLHALLRANDFLAKHRAAIPSLKPLFCTPRSKLVRYLLRAPWEQEA